jgi:hypothetical protein
LVADTNRKQLEWLGYVKRMDQKRVVKRTFESKPEWRRKVGRPRLRWLDDVEIDLRVMKVKRWRKKAQNREAWASVIKEAKEQASNLGEGVRGTRKVEGRGVGCTRKVREH